MTQFMSNTASCALLALSVSPLLKGMGADPHAVLMAIGVAASCAFGTPVGTPPNTLVLGPGQYKFTDYVKSRRSIDFSLLRSKQLSFQWYGHSSLVNNRDRLLYYTSTYEVES